MTSPAPNPISRQRRAVTAAVPESGIKIDELLAEFESIRGPQFGERTLLRRRESAGAQDETANATLCMHGRKVCLI